MGKRAVVGLLGLGRKAAAGELPALEVIAEALAAQALARAAVVGAGAAGQVLSFLAVHKRLPLN